MLTKLGLKAALVGSLVIASAGCGSDDTAASGGDSSVGGTDAPNVMCFENDVAKANDMFKCACVDTSQYDSREQALEHSKEWGYEGEVSSCSNWCCYAFPEGCWCQEDGGIGIGAGSSCQEFADVQNAEIVDNCNAWVAERL